MYSLFEQGGGADCKVGVQNRIRERSERKIFFVPLILAMQGYKQANISIWAY